MPKIKLKYNTYQQIVGDEWGRTAHSFYQQGDNALSRALNQVAQDITAWAGNDPEKNNQVRALRNKIRAVVDGIDKLARRPGNPANQRTFNDVIHSFDELQSILESEVYPGGDTVFRHMAKNYQKRYPRYEMPVAENEIKKMIKNVTDVIYYEEEDRSVDYDSISQAQAKLDSQAEERARQEAIKAEEDAKKAEQKAFDDSIDAKRNDPEWLNQEFNQEKIQYLQNHKNGEFQRFHYGEEKLSDDMLKTFRDREISEFQMGSKDGALADRMRNTPLTDMYEALRKFAEELNERGNKNYDPAEVKGVEDFARACKLMQQGLGHGNYHNVYEDEFTQGWEIMRNKVLPKFNQKKGDKTYYQWLFDKLVERGSFTPTKLNTVFDILSNDYQIPLSDELRNTGIVYSGTAGRWIQSYQSNGTNMKALDKLITELTAKKTELEALGNNRKPHETTLFNQINGILPHAEHLQKLCKDPRMKDRSFRVGEGQKIVTAAVRSFNSELSSLEDRMSKSAFKKTFGEFHEKWRQTKYEVKRDNVQDKTRTWKSYLDFHTGENADGREDEYLAKACVAWKHAYENPQRKFSLKTARREAQEFMKSPEYQALILDKKVTKMLLRGRRFDLIPTYLQDPYSYGTEKEKLKTALRDLRKISESVTGEGKTEQEKAFRDSLKNIWKLSDNDINDISLKDAAKLVQEASKGAMTFISSGQADYASEDGKKFSNAALDAAVTLGSVCNYGKHVMQNVLKNAGAQYKAAGLGKLDQKLYGMKGRVERKKLEDAKKESERQKELEDRKKHAANIKKLAGKHAKSPYQVKPEDIAKLPKVTPAVKNPIEITDQAENLRGSFTGEYGNAQYQAYRKAVILTETTAFSDNGKVVVDGDELDEAVGGGKIFALQDFYKTNDQARENLEKIAKEGGDFLGQIRKDYDALMKQREKEKVKEEEKGPAPMAPNELL